MNCGHLFNGIGGFGLAAHWMGWTNVFHCEIDDFCNRVMNKHFPESIQHGNIKEQDFTGYRGAIDLLTGGFPCQPYSTAGKRKGKEDDRHLWPEMLRTIREIQPPWVVGENVRGLTNWNGGLVFDEVQADLEAEGYEVLPFLLPACTVNAPHRRDRIWFIAYATGFRCNRNVSSWERLQRTEQARREVGAGNHESGFASDTASVIRWSDSKTRLEMDGNLLEITEWKEGSDPTESRFSDNGWNEFPTQSPFVEEMMGFPINWTDLNHWVTQ